MLKNLFVLTLSIFLLAGCTTDKPQTNEPNAKKKITDQELIDQGKLIETEDGLVASPEYTKEMAEELKKIEDTASKDLQSNVDLANEVLQGDDDKKAGRDIKGSCNAIAEGSSCIEYYGSFWTETQIKAQCEGAGTFSNQGCPSDMAGGCNTGYETMADMVVWMYLRGGGEITKESLKYAKMACDATMASKWLTSK